MEFMVYNVYDSTYHEAFGETTAKSGRKYWIRFGLSKMPDLSEVTKLTNKFAYFDTPCGRMKYRR